MVAPEVGEAHEAKVLEREERDAEAAARFRMFEDGHGKWHGRFTLPGLQGAMLKKSLMAYAAPKHRASVEGQAPEPGLPSAHRLGRAFMEYVEPLPDRPAPQGRRDVRVGGGGDGLRDPARQAQGRRARHRPPDLTRPGPEAGRARPGSSRPSSAAKSQVLDLGRSTRFHTNAQRIALTIEQGGCTAEGCDAPPAMTPRPPRPTLVRRAATPASRTAGCSAPATTPEPTTRLHDDQAPRRPGQVPPANVSKGVRPEVIRNREAPPMASLLTW